MIEILIIAVLYNTPAETFRFLRSIERCGFKSLRVILVDNSEHENRSLEEEIKQLKIDVEYLKSPKNLGYFGGADYGLNHFLNKNSLPAWVLISNVDIVFDQQDFFHQLSTMQWPEKTGVVAPAIISQKWKTDTNPKISTRYSKERMNFYRMVCTNTFTQNTYMTVSYFKKILTGRKKAEAGSPGERKRIYAAHGSCMIFHKRYFELGGTLKHISFLFGEEIFVAETARSLELETVYEPRLRVSDHEHASTGFFYSKKIAGYMKQSTLDIISHYYSQS